MKRWIPCPRCGDDNWFPAEVTRPLPCGRCQLVVAVGRLEGKFVLAVGKAGRSFPLNQKARRAMDRESRA